jgi:hypothetical protein
MALIIPLDIEDKPKDCLIELRDIVEGGVITEIFRGRCQPGLHEIPFDPSAVTGLEAGLYALHITIDGYTETFPIQYMP